MQGLSHCVVMGHQGWPVTFTKVIELIDILQHFFILSTSPALSLFEAPHKYFLSVRCGIIPSYWKVALFSADEHVTFSTRSQNYFSACKHKAHEKKKNYLSKRKLNASTLWFFFFVCVFFSFTKKKKQNNFDLDMTLQSAYVVSDTDGGAGNSFTENVWQHVVCFAQSIPQP